MIRISWDDFYEAYKNWHAYKIANPNDYGELSPGEMIVDLAGEEAPPTTTFNWLPVNISFVDANEDLARKIHAIRGPHFYAILKAMDKIKEHKREQGDTGTHQQLPEVPESPAHAI